MLAPLQVGYLHFSGWPLGGAGPLGSDFESGCCPGGRGQATAVSLSLPEASGTACACACACGGKGLGYQEGY